MSAGFDRVLEASPPSFDGPEAADIGHRSFGVDAVDATDLGSERDQTFLLLGRDEAPLAVMKVSNAAEDPTTLDMEALAALHAGATDPGLPVALPWTVPGADPATDGAAAYRTRLEAGGSEHLIRMYDVLPGRSRFEPGDLDDAACIAWGETTARLGRALRGFFHPNARRTMLWDIQHAPATRPFLADVTDARHRELAARALDRFEEVVVPAWPGLRAQVVHGDLTVDNALIDDRGRITAVIDFGDMSHSALVMDVSSAVDSLIGGRGDDRFRAARLIVDGYERITPLEPGELRILGELIAARAAVTITITSWRVARGLEEASFAQRFNDLEADTIETFLDLGWDEVARRLGADVPRGTDAELGARRSAALGPAMEPLTYEHPIRMASATGVWMTDAEGRTYLDTYNNVPCVGHAHPRVTGAIARQARVLNTNMRYLHAGAIELAERLAATCPDGLDTVLFVNSGSEANDLAWRLATAVTGHTGGLCTSFAYHGISDAIAPLSPETWPGGRRPDHIETWTPFDPYRDEHAGVDGFAAAVERLRARGHEPAVAILDGVLTSDGFVDQRPEDVRGMVAMTHELGGLWIADEVQGGHGRTGDALWSFERFGIVPDLVTLGKPMGNGHPVAAVITRREIAERFGEQTVFFSTFGGNPVSAAAALAVLDVIEDERILERVRAAGEDLRAAVREVAARHPVVGDVRGVGLANGIELVSDPVAKTPDPAATSAVKDAMRERGVLVGTTGPHGNVLKVRPPLAFTAAEVPLFATTLDDALGSLA